MNNQTFEERWMHEFVARLKHRMEYLGISRRELAKRAGITYDAITKWINYRNGPTAMHLVKIAKVLAVNPQYLIDFPDLTYHNGDEQTEELKHE